MILMLAQKTTVTPLLDVPMNKSTVTTITNVLLTAAVNPSAVATHLNAAMTIASVPLTLVIKLLDVSTLLYP
jgi:hypothetical protein